MKTEIQNNLTQIENLKGVEILFAVESGSRAWGFESRNSDWDVRFIYTNHLDWYLRINPQRDVIENHELTQLPDRDEIMDFAGWDLRKFFQLISRSNPTAFEWLQSTIVYRELNVWDDVRKIAAQFFSPKAAMYHYLSMARHNYREHMRDGQADKVKLKKYLYITRPLLCCRWIEEERTPPPMPFNEVLPLAPSNTYDELKALVKRKKAGEELDEGPAVGEINEFIAGELARLPDVAKDMVTNKGDTGLLDEMLHWIIVGEIR